MNNTTPQLGHIENCYCPTCNDVSGEVWNEACRETKEKPNTKELQAEYSKGYSAGYADSIRDYHESVGISPED